MNSGCPLPADSAQRAPARETVTIKLALTGLAGASIEWYDFFLYATAAALVFPTVFLFGSPPPFVACARARHGADRSLQAAGYGRFLRAPGWSRGVRTYGGPRWAQGDAGSGNDHDGSRHYAHRPPALIPFRRILGATRPVLLRFVQGLAVGGQWGGAILLATESAPKTRCGLYGSIAQAGVPIGVVLANVAFLIASSATSPKAFAAYGWRIPFPASIVLVGLGVFVRFRVGDTAAFRHLKQLQAALGRFRGFHLCGAGLGGVSSLSGTDPFRRRRLSVVESDVLYSHHLRSGIWYECRGFAYATRCFADRSADRQSRYVANAFPRRPVVRPLRAPPDFHDGHCALGVWAFVLFRLL